MVGLRKVYYSMPMPMPAMQGFSGIQLHRRTGVINKSKAPQRSPGSNLFSGPTRTVEPPVIRKTFPESWIFDSLNVDEEYVFRSLAR